MSIDLTDLTHVHKVIKSLQSYFCALEHETAGDQTGRSAGKAASKQLTSAVAGPT